ncbi:MAG: nicotinate-nucleotide adenylyltransferase [Prevotellaceae bacterium]|jgi:nicotinate-nucleotide adenylyltransferase|nr:nicotinate-nucleotide adenylyltransferase [Prevotellaceae bacterium]
MQAEKIRKNVVLYFGSFNPVHNGHFGLVNYLIDNNLTRELWFVVSPRNPLKLQAGLIDENLRIEMVRLAIGENLLLQASDIEFFMPKPSYTVDTLQVLQTKFPNTDFSLLTGSDNALVFNKWKDYKTILKRVEVLVYPRESYDFQKVAHVFPQMKLLADAPVFEISSTQIRDELARGKTALARKWLQPKILDFILKNNLYCN